MRAYDTQNSTYLIDLENMRYKRLPGARRHGDDLSHRLAYDEWHPLAVPPVLTEWGELHIMRSDSIVGIFTSPVVREYDIEHPGGGETCN